MLIYCSVSHSHILHWSLVITSHAHTMWSCVSFITFGYLCFSTTYKLYVFASKYVFGSVGGGKKKKDQHHDSTQMGMAMNSAYPGVYGAAPPVSYLNFFLTLILIHAFRRCSYLIIVLYSNHCSYCHAFHSFPKYHTLVWNPFCQRHQLRQITSSLSKTCLTRQLQWCFRSCSAST